MTEDGGQRNGFSRHDVSGTAWASAAGLAARLFRTGVMAEVAFARRLATGALDDFLGFARNVRRGQQLFQVLAAAMRAHRRLVAHQQLEGLVAGLTVKVEDGGSISNAHFVFNVSLDTTGDTCTNVYVAPFENVSGSFTNVSISGFINITKSSS